MRLTILTCTYFAAINDSTTVWSIGDIGVGAMAWINFIAIIILHKPVMIALNDYISQRKQGIDPSFNPIKLGIKNASKVWTNETKDY